jgi:hypothetical protein
MTYSEEAFSQSETVEKREILTRFGITAPLGISGYDLGAIHAVTFLDWSAENNRVPDGVEYIHVIKLHDDVYAKMIDNLPGIVARNLGAVWIIGNEPDRFFYQDSITPEVYAERYYEVGVLIKGIDPTARLGFGTVVQPTPIRIRYLERSLARLKLLAGSSQAAFAMIDIWSIHAFILNEEESGWGAGIPVGFDCAKGDCTDAIKIKNFADTYSVEILQKRIVQFRIWMSAIGEKNKPLWITEYGSLFPPIDPPGGPNYINVSDADTAKFMLASFDYMLSVADANIGCPCDDHKLVQRWYWYSLNDHRYNFGGSMFDPDNEKKITEVGLAYQKYIEKIINQKVFIPLVKK